MVLVNMLMEIDPLSMRGSMVMTMAMIPPSQRDASPVEQLRRSARLVLPRFRLETAALFPKASLWFFPGHIAKAEHRGPARWPTRQGARPPPSWLVGGPHLVLSFPNVFNIFENQLSWSFRTFGVVHDRSLIFAPFPAQNPSCRHSPSSYKSCKIRENSHKYCDITWNNSP